MILFYVLFGLLLLLLFANYATGVFRLSKRTYVALIIFVLFTGQLFNNSLPKQFYLPVLIIAGISFLTLYYFVAHEKSEDVEKMIFDINWLLKTGELPPARDSSLLKTEEKQKIDENFEKLQQLRDQFLNKKED